MVKKTKKSNEVRENGFEISSFSDLVNLNLKTLEKVVSGDIDNKKAALIFTGSRTVTGTLKLGLEARKLGMKDVAGVNVESGFARIEKL